MIRLALLCTAALAVAVPFDLRSFPTGEVIPFADDPEIVNVGTGTFRKPLPRDEADILARALLGEVAKQGDDEVRAVIGVVFNRLQRGSYGPTISDVVLYHKRGVWAFSAFDPVRAKWDNVWADNIRQTPGYKRMIRLIDAAWQAPPAHGFTHYFHPAAMHPAGTVPRWAVGKPATRIGTALFIQ